MFGHFFSNVIHTVGHAAGSALHTVSNVSGKVSGAISHVPAIGPAFHSIYDIGLQGPLNVANNIAHGMRIDHVMLSALKERVKDIQEIAPYAQMAVQFVPGVGQGVSGAIGAGLALSQGRRITDALKEGIKGALPGGPIARSAFNVGDAIMSGRGIDNAALAALPISDEERRLLKQGLGAAKAIAKGERVDHAIVDRALAALPPDAQKAIKIGMAIGHGESLQHIARNAVNPFMFSRLAHIGGLDHSPVVNVGRSILRGAHEAQRGYNAALGLVRFQHVPLVTLEALRKRMNEKMRHGFDLGLALHVGRVTRRRIKGGPRKRFGYYVAHGMSGHKPKAKAYLAAIITHDPEIKKGVVKAISQRKNVGFWERVLEFFHIHKKAS